MTDNPNLKKKIIYRSTHRGSKEMDILLGSFVKSYIDELNTTELIELKNFLLHEDEFLLNFYNNKKSSNKFERFKVYKSFRNFKL